MKILNALFLILVSISGIAQSLSSIVPNTGATGTTVSVTIAGVGTNFNPNALSGSLNKGLSAVLLSNIQVLGATSFVADVAIPPNADTGSYTLRVRSGNRVLALQNAFTVSRGSGNGSGIQSISPQAGSQGQTLLLTLTGNNTLFTQSENLSCSLASLNGIPIASLTAFAQSDTELLCLINIPADATIGQYSVVVTTSNQGILTLPNAFTINGEAIIVRVSPTQANQGNTVFLNIVGQNTRFEWGQFYQVTLTQGISNPILATLTVVGAPDEMFATISIPEDATPGLYDVSVLSLTSGILTLPAAFTINQVGGNTDVQLSSIHPTYGHPQQEMEMIGTFRGIQLNNSSSITMSIGNMVESVNASQISIQNDSQVRATFLIPPTFTPGSYDVSAFVDYQYYTFIGAGFLITTVGLPQLQRAIPIAVYPVPAATSFTVQTKSAIAKMVFTDLLGKEVSVLIPEHNSGIVTSQIPDAVKQHTPYLLRITTADGSGICKFLRD
jgi:hypothetical protein